MRITIQALALATLLAPARLGAEGPLPEVREISIRPGAGTTQVLILASDTLEVRDFGLPAPPRIVLDFLGARDGLPREEFTDIARGGIVAIRSSQYRPDVVRVTLDLEKAGDYSTFRMGTNLLLVLETPSPPFEPWSSAGPTPGEPAEGGGEAAAVGEAAGEGETGAGTASGGEVAPLGRALTPEQEPAGPPPGAEVRAPGRRITVDFQDANIRAVLRAFSEFSGESIVAGTDIAGTLTATITNLPWDRALEVLLRANGYGMIYQQGIYRVARLESLREAEKLEDLGRHVFRLNFIKPRDIQSTVKGMLSERGTVSNDEKSNSLIVTDVEGILQEVARVLGELDIQTKQVTIKSQLVFINTIELREFGITWIASNMVNPRTDVHGEASSLGARLTDPFLSLSLGTFRSGVNVNGLLQAMEQRQLVDVQAQPQITTLDNLPATVFVGERTPVRVLDIGAQVARAASVQLIETGIKLTVTPHITNTNKIVMDLHAERSAAVPDVSEFGVKFQTQEGTTTLLVDDGQTAVIGGLTTFETTKSRSGLPLLSRIPLLGRLFSFTSTKKEKRDLLIFVTPYVVPTAG